jgi:hypothetical protein
MSLLGAPEVAALSYDPVNSVVCGVRMRVSRRDGFEVVKSASSCHSEWQRGAESVLKELNVNSSVYLVLALPLEGSEVFDCTLPAASAEVMREALRFEVPRRVMSMSDDFRLQFVPLAEADESGMIKVRCSVFPESSLLNTANQVAALRIRPDALIHPLLTVPTEMPEAAAVQLAGCEKDFCWQNGSWQLAPENCNQELDSVLRNLCGKADGETDFPAGYRTAVAAALFGIRRLFGKSSVLAGVTVLPDFLRPARFRSQLRLMALLVLLLIGVNAFRYAGDFLSTYREHRKLSNQLSNLRTKVQAQRKELKTAEKQLKEFQRTAELKIGSRECLGYLGYLSEKLPDDVLLNNFRWNEGTIDMNLQTTSPDLDLVSFFNRLPGFKVLSASQRTNPGNNFTNANVKLSIIEPQVLIPGKVKSKAKAKTKK